MMNAIAVQGMNYLLREPMIDPVQLESASRIPQTARLAVAFDLPRLIPTRLHLGFGLAILAAILVYIFPLENSNWLPHSGGWLECVCFKVCGD